MEDFLPAMRQNMLSKKRPFGMPDIDDGDVGKMFNDVLPFVNQMKQQDEIRRRDRMMFDRSMQQRPQLSMTDKAYGATAPGNATPMGGTVSGGPSTFSPMQRQFQLRDEEERQNKFRAEQAGLERSNKLSAVMDEARLRDSGETARLGQTLNARKEEGSAERASREKISTDELAARIKAVETERASRAAEGQSDRISRERIAGMPARTQPTSATQQGNQFENRIQQLAIDNPEAAALVTKDPDTGQFKFKGGTPEQQAWVKNYLSQQATPDKSNAPKMITQRNKRTGETRQVPVK